MSELPEYVLISRNHYASRLECTPIKGDEWSHISKERHQELLREARIEALKEAADYFKHAAAISKDERWNEAAGYEGAARWCEEKAAEK